MNNTSILFTESSSSSHAASTDFPYSLSLSLSLSFSLSLSLSLSASIPIIHCSRHVFQTTSCVRTELMSVSSCWSANTGMSKKGHPWSSPFSFNSVRYVLFVSINGRFCLVSLKNPTFSNIFPRAKHVLMTFEFLTLCACLCIFSLYISHLLLSSQQAPIDMWTISYPSPDDG